jgi:uncharacterized protein YjbJ (UPF0337 family)
MNWEDIRAKWMQFKGSMKQHWAELTDDDLDYISGTRDRLIGTLQVKYGITREEAERRAEEWFRTQRNPAA